MSTEVSHPPKPKKPKPSDARAVLTVRSNQHARTVGLQSGNSWVPFVSAPSFSPHVRSNMSSICYRMLRALVFGTYVSACRLSQKSASWERRNLKNKKKTFWKFSVLHPDEPAALQCCVLRAWAPGTITPRIEAGKLLVYWRRAWQEKEYSLGHNRLAFHPGGRKGTAKRSLRGQEDPVRTSSSPARSETSCAGIEDKRGREPRMVIWQVSWRPRGGSRWHFYY